MPGCRDHNGDIDLIDFLKLDTDKGQQCEWNI